MPPKSTARRAAAKARQRFGDQSAPGENEERFSNAFAVFRERWPGASEEEFRTYLDHTAMTLGKSNILAHLDWNNAFRVAAFLVQVDYTPDGSYDLAARTEITRAAEAAGFKNVDSSMSRAAFNFVPGSWERFQQIVKAAARESGITLKRVLFCSAALGMVFRFPEDIPTESTELRAGFVEYILRPPEHLPSPPFK